MANDDWVSLQKAYEHVLNIRRFPERAHHELLEKLRSNEIGARAKSLKLGLDYASMDESIDRPMSSYLFQAGHVDFAQSSLTKPPAAGSRNLWTAHAVEARDIEILRSELLTNWPAVPEKTLKKGGRQEEHDWTGALAYCGWWVAINGLPAQKARLTELVTDWFKKEDGGAPKDPDAIRKRISRAYDELAKLEDRRRTGV